MEAVAHVQVLVESFFDCLKKLDDLNVSGLDALAKYQGGPGESAYKDLQESHKALTDAHSELLRTHLDIGSALENTPVDALEALMCRREGVSTSLMDKVDLCAMLFDCYESEYSLKDSTLRSITFETPPVTLVAFHALWDRRPFLRGDARAAEAHAKLFAAFAPQRPRSAAK